MAENFYKDRTSARGSNSVKSSRRLVNPLSKAIFAAKSPIL
jgi:hypothetical protein